MLRSVGCDGTADFPISQLAPKSGSTSLSAWTVTADWPDPVPITDAEFDVFEAWFGDLFDELFGPRR